MKTKDGIYGEIAFTVILVSTIIVVLIAPGLRGEEPAAPRPDSSNVRPAPATRDSAVMAALDRMHVAAGALEHLADHPESTGFYQVGRYCGMMAAMAMSADIVAGGDPTRWTEETMNRYADSLARDIFRREKRRRP